MWFRYDQRDILRRAMNSKFETRSPEYKANQEIELSKDDQETIRRFIKNMEAPARNILELLRLKIEAHEYDSILGDDADARIHTLVLAQAIQDIYGDQKKLHTVFVKGGSILRNDDMLQKMIPEHKMTTELRNKLITGEVARVQNPFESEEDDTEEKTEPEYRWKETSTHRDEVRAYLERMKPRLGSKTLYITEEIDSGSTIDILFDCLRSLGIDAEAASYGITNSGETEDGIFVTRRGTPIVVGRDNIGPAVPDAFQGVLNAQGPWTSPHATEDLSRSGRGHAVRMYYDRQGRSVQARVNAAHRAARTLGHKLAIDFKSKK